jgi:hypothetical protein
MHALRSMLMKRRQLALVLILLAIAMKALLPGGYMISGSAKTFTISICSGTDGARTTAEITIPAKAPTHQEEAQGKADSQCPFSSLSMAALGGADAPLLALALAFILALGFLPAPSLPFRPAHYLLPPLRGPPATA